MRWAISTGVQASKRTIQRRLRAAGVRNSVAVKKPLLSKKHRDKRLSWAREHQHWTTADWQRIVFSDETPLYLIQTKQRRYIWHRLRNAKSSRIYRPSVQAGGGHIMVWAGIHGSETVPLRRVVGTLRGPQYTDILSERLLPVLHANPHFHLQQDNAPCHKSAHVRHWMEGHDVNVISWPAQSPDLNPVENMWAELKRRLECLQIDTMEQLWHKANDIWSSIEPEIVTAVVDSMPRRIQEVIQNRGRHTHY
jgi:hypothetical protein